MDRGVNSLLGQDVPRNTVHCQPRRNEAPGNVIGAPKEAEVSLESEDTAVSASQPADFFLEPEAATALHSDISEQSADLPEDSLEQVVPVDDTLSPVHPAHLHVAQVLLTQEDVLGSEEGRWLNWESPIL